MKLKFIFIVLLTAILAIISIGNIIVAIINPEAYFFGNKFGGISAIIYLLINSFFSGMIIYLFYKKLQIVLTLSLLYFIYNISESVMTSMILFHEYRSSSILIFGLILSILILILNKAETKREQCIM